MADVLLLNAQRAVQTDPTMQNQATLYRLQKRMGLKPTLDFCKWVRSLLVEVAGKPTWSESLATKGWRNKWSWMSCINYQKVQGVVKEVLEAFAGIPDLRIVCKHAHDGECSKLGEGNYGDQTTVLVYDGINRLKQCTCPETHKGRRVQLNEAETQVGGRASYTCEKHGKRKLVLHRWTTHDGVQIDLYWAIRVVSRKEMTK